PSYARLEVRAGNAQLLEEILNAIHDHGAVPVSAHDCAHELADMDGAFPEGFYSTTNYRTQVRLGGEWVEVEEQEMDGGILLAVLGPAVVHTGSVEHICALVRTGYLNVLFAGNALATHDIEQALYGTSLGVSLERGLPAEEGHEHHLRAINTMRRLGGIKAAVDKGVLKSGIMYECVRHDIPFVLAGSIRDDGPLPE